MRIGRTLPPAASPIYIRDIINGFKGLFRGQAEIGRFKSDLKEQFGAKHCFLVSSGKAALTLILEALHDLHPERDEVLIPAFICYSVPSAIVRAGLKVKLCDVNPDTLNFNYDQLREAIAQSSKLNGEEVQSSPMKWNKDFTGQTKLKGQSKSSNTRDYSKTEQPVSSFNKQQTTNNNRLIAVIPAHLFGLPANVEHVRSLVDDPLVSIVEDAAQVFGSTWNEKKLGTLGDVGFFSLGRGKALSTVEGGIILTNRDDIADSINSRLPAIPEYTVSELIKLIINSILLTFLQHPAFFWLPKSLPFLKVGDTIYDPHFKINKLSSFQAGLAKNWNYKLEKLKNNRKENSRLWSSLIDIDCLYQFRPKNGNTPDMLRYPISIADRDLWEDMLKKSNKNGHGIMFTYPSSVNYIDELSQVFKGQSYPAAEKLPHQLVTLPIHSYVSQKDIKKILDSISQVKNL